MGRGSRCGWLLVATVVAALDPAVGEIRRLVVSQVRQLEGELPAVRAYLKVVDSSGAVIWDEIQPKSLSATLGEARAELTALERFEARQRGVAYVFLVDVSRSLNHELSREVVDNLEAWIADLGPADRAAVIAFGSVSRLEVDFTGDAERLRAGLRGLGPSDDRTILHRALVDALDLCRRLDPSLPGRRAIVLFSDGKDEGSGLAAEDVLAELRDQPTPIYAIGHSQIRDPSERRVHLELLHRYATNSGGAYFEAGATDFGDTYGAIREAIRRVWVADFSCAGCRPDGGLERLQVQLSLEGRVLADGADLRLLPGETPPARPTAVTSSAPAIADPTPPVAEEPAEGESYRPGWWLLLGAVLAGVGGFSWRFLGSRRRAGDGPVDMEPAPPADPEPVLDEPEIVATLRAPEPQAESVSSHAARWVRLVVIRGSRRGRRYSFPMQGKAVVGQRSDCDCVLADEPGIAARQFELAERLGRISIRDLSNGNPTLVNGLTIEESAVIQDNALIGTGETILRLVLG